MSLVPLCLFSQNFTFSLLLKKGGWDTLLSLFLILQAIATRDAMAKCLYGALFDWIVLKVNQALLAKRHNSDHQVIKIRSGSRNTETVFIYLTVISCSSYQNVATWKFDITCNTCTRFTITDIINRKKNMNIANESHISLHYSPCYHNWIWVSLEVSTIVRITL